MADYDFEQSGTTFELTDWKRFESFIESLQTYHTKDELFTSNSLLFRGHGSADWKLATTLEREYPFNQSDNAEKVITFNNYYSQILTSKAAIGSYTGQNWDLPTTEDFDQTINELLDGTWLMGDGYEKLKEVISFMAHLRHHDYPSPLLDWTASPYVALYFAYRGCIKEKDLSNKEVAVYVYKERGGINANSMQSTNKIKTIGHTIQTHARHCRQQSEYTLCLLNSRTDPTSGQKYSDSEYWYFSSHERLLTQSDHDEEHDQWWKITMPASEWKHVLAQLYRRNITAYSLFGSEESLMETLAMKQALNIRT